LNPLGFGRVPRRRLALAILLCSSALGMFLVPYLAPVLRPVSQAASPPFVFAAAGDFGNSWNSTGETGKVVSGIAGSGASFAIALGDLAYATNASKSWCSNFKRIYKDVVVIAGNHDSGPSNYGPMDVYNQACPFSVPGAKLIPGTITDDNGTSYGYEYAFDYPALNPIARFILLTPNITWRCCGLSGIYLYNRGSTNYQWVSARIDEAKARGEWVIMGWHINPLSSNHVFDLPTDAWKLAFEKKVDLVISGHDHVYERTYQLSCGNDTPSCIGNGNSGSYGRGRGLEYVIQGTGGRPFSNILPDPVFVKGSQNNTQHGFVKYTVSSGTLAGQFVSVDGSFTDGFSISSTQGSSFLLQSTLLYGSYALPCVDESESFWARVLRRQFVGR